CIHCIKGLQCLIIVFISRIAFNVIEITGNDKSSHLQVRLAANSLVTKDIKEPGDYAGFPAIPVQEWRRQVANQRRISKQVSSKFPMN
ncbi:Probable UDP-3-O-acylglucosamine N-acyltransferase 2, mitochondrial, partial [Linum grandiflorum]